MADKISLKGDASKGIYTVYERGQLLDFILTEPSTPNGKGRKEVAIHDKQVIGALCDADGVPVDLTDATKIADVAGVCMTEPATVPGLTANWYDLKSCILVGAKGFATEIKSTILASNGFRNVTFDGSKFKCTGQDKVTGASAAQANLDAVIKALSAAYIDVVPCGA